METKVECIRALLPLGLMHLHEVLEDEVCALAKARYARKAANFPGRRHGNNPDHTEIMVRAPRRCSQGKPFGQAQDKL